jgi:DNA polymerase III delta prime subunit
MQKIHHANIVLGNSRDFIFNILEKDLNFNIKANPDFLLVENDFFGIDDARDLEKWAMGKPLIGEVKVSLIIIKSITHEAQNALLKVLEEPTIGTYIFINLENLGGLLGTFLSRVRVLNPSGQNNTEDSNAHKFLNSKIKEKLSIIQSLSKKENKSETKELIKNLEGVAYKSNFKSQDLKSILTAKIFASTRGSSPKMLLEWLSCVLQ